MPETSTRVWDLPTRLFHWSLVLLVVAAFVTQKIGGAWVEWHFRIGYAILALVAFRVIWGFVGGRHARFASFVRGPAAVMATLRGTAPEAPGHNPLGALSVLGMLVAVGAQGMLGLFANDDIASEGPLAKLVSKELSDRLTSLHHLGEKVIIALVLLHVAAIMYYLHRKRKNLVRPMLTGDKPDVDPSLAARDDAALRLRALVVLAACAAFVGWLVR